MLTVARPSVYGRHGLGVGKHKWLGEDAVARAVVGVLVHGHSDALLDVGVVDTNGAEALFGIGRLQQHIQQAHAFDDGDQAILRELRHKHAQRSKQARMRQNIRGNHFVSVAIGVKELGI
eukprot:4599049-Pleurochrysis_carterae.AAC.3